MAVSFQKILCVDDEPCVLRTLALVLSHHGYTVLEAADAGEACRIAACGSIDIALVDHSVCMREKVCLRELLQETQPEIKLVLHSGQPEIKCCVANTVIVPKPTHPQRLVSIIRELCASAQGSQELQSSELQGAK